MEMTITELHFKLRDLRAQIQVLELELIAACWRSVSGVKCTCGGYEDGMHGQLCGRRQEFETRFIHYR